MYWVILFHASHSIILIFVPAFSFCRDPVYWSQFLPGSFTPKSSNGHHHQTEDFYLGSWTNTPYIFFPLHLQQVCAAFLKKYFCFALYLIAGEIPTSFLSLLISFSGLFPFPLLSTWCMHSSQFLYPYPVIYFHFMTTHPVMAGRQILLELVFQISHEPLKIQVYF